MRRSVELELVARVPFDIIVRACGPDKADTTRIAAALGEDIRNALGDDFGGRSCCAANVSVSALVTTGSAVVKFLVPLPRDQSFERVVGLLKEIDVWHSLGDCVGHSVQTINLAARKRSSVPATPSSLSAAEREIEVFLKGLSVEGPVSASSVSRPPPPPYESFNGLQATQAAGPNQIGIPPRGLVLPLDGLDSDETRRAHVALAKAASLRSPVALSSASAATALVVNLGSKQEGGHRDRGEEDTTAAEQSLAAGWPWEALESQRMCVAVPACHGLLGVLNLSVGDLVHVNIHSFASGHVQAATTHLDSSPVIDVLDVEALCECEGQTLEQGSAPALPLSPVDTIQMEEINAIEVIENSMSAGSSLQDVSFLSSLLQKDSFVNTSELVASHSGTDAGEENGQANEPAQQHRFTQDVLSSAVKQSSYIADDLNAMSLSCAHDALLAAGFLSGPFVVGPHHSNGSVWSSADFRTIVDATADTVAPCDCSISKVAHLGKIFHLKCLKPDGLFVPREAAVPLLLRPHPGLLSVGYVLMAGGGGPGDEPQQQQQVGLLFDGSLAQLTLQNTSRLRLKQIVRPLLSNANDVTIVLLLHQAAHSIDHLLSESVAHRNCTLENLWLSEEGRLVLGGLQFALRLSDDSAVLSERELLAAPSLAPEVRGAAAAAGRAATPLPSTRVLYRANDVWSIGRAMCRLVMSFTDGSHTDDNRGSWANGFSDCVLQLLANLISPDPCDRPSAQLLSTVTGVLLWGCATPDGGQSPRGHSHDVKRARDWLLDAKLQVVSSSQHNLAQDATVEHALQIQHYCTVSPEAHVEAERWVSQHLVPPRATTDTPQY